MRPGGESKKEKEERSHIHLPCDNLVLSLEHLIFAYEIPDANWPNNAGPGPRLVTRWSGQGGGAPLPDVSAEAQ